MSDNTAVQQILEYDSWLDSIVYRDQGYTSDESERLFFPLKENKDVSISITYKNYGANKLHFLIAKKGDITFERAWKEDVDFSSLKELSSKQEYFIGECLRKLK